MIAHTPGPWRWEINRKSKRISLCGGKPQFDLTVMEFSRWGMGNAQPVFRQIEDRMDLLHKVSERPDWVTPITGREHHKEWCATISHPDAALIASAPELLDAAERLMEHYAHCLPDHMTNEFREAIAKAKGKA